MITPEALKRQWLEEDERLIDSAIAALLEHAHGRKLLWWLLDIGGVGSQPFTGNALTTAFGCGALNIGNQVLARIIEVSPEGYLTMVKEQANERTDRDGHLRAAYGTDGRADGADESADGTDQYD